jgi:putative acetyltransferase
MSGRPRAIAHIRPEQPGDAARIHRVNELAFEQATEADIVDALRDSGGFVLSLVAVLGSEPTSMATNADGALVDERLDALEVDAEMYGGEIVAHALVTPVSVSTEEGGVSLLGLGPVAVLPSEQGRGIGTCLVEACLEQLRVQGHAGVVVVGEPEYYRRFGFIPASRWGLRWEIDVPDENFMVIELSPGRLAGVSGVVRYRPEFSQA